MDMRDSKNTHPEMGKKHYFRLLIMGVCSFISMYILMYAMVDKFDNIFPNLNQFYMASLMTAPMIIIELSLMSSMFQQKKWNILIIAFSVTLLVGSFTLIRQQAAINDEQFLRSMISHHASALLMCEEASITDPEIKELCDEILASQQSEIDEMKAKLQELRK